MAGKKTRALTKDEFIKMVETFQCGGYEYTEIKKGEVVVRKARPNKRLAVMVILQANIGVRICDLVNLKMENILQDGDDFQMNIVEQKTGKLRDYIIDKQMVDLLKQFCEENKIAPNEKIFNMTIRNAQDRIKGAVEYLGYKGVSTHSARKYFATEMYELSDHDIILVQKLLLHSDPKTTLRYIGISKQKQKSLLTKFTCNPLNTVS